MELKISLYAQILNLSEAHLAKQKRAGEILDYVEQEKS